MNVRTAWSDAAPLEKFVSLIIETPVFDENDVRSRLEECGLPQKRGVIRESIDMLQLYSLLDRDGSGYRFGLSEFPRIVRESGVAAAQIESSAAEVLG